MSQLLPPPALSLADFLADPDPRPYELVDGQKRYKDMANYAEHGAIIFKLAILLNAYITGRGGRVFTETTFILALKSDWVRGAFIPDVLYIAPQRWAAYVQATPNWRKQPLVLSPDLAIEVLSENDTWPEIEAKVARYAEAGVGLVWAVDPKTEQIHVYRGAAVAHIYTRDEILSEPSLLPDFRLSVAELFAD